MGQPLPLGKNPNVRDSQNDFFFTVPHISETEPGINISRIMIRASGHPRDVELTRHGTFYGRDVSWMRPTEMVRGKRYHFLYTHSQEFDPYEDIKLEGTYVGHFETDRNQPKFLILKNILVRSQADDYVYAGPYKFLLENIVSIEKGPDSRKTHKRKGTKRGHSIGGKKMNKNKTKRGGVRKRFTTQEYYKEFDGDFVARSGTGNATVSWYRKGPRDTLGELECRYVGDIKDWKQNGSGVFTFFDKGAPTQVNTGTWVGGAIVGNVHVDWPQKGETYDGPFLNDKPHGPGGRRTWPDGRVYVGEHENGRPSRGVITSLDGSRAILGDIVDPREYEPPPLDHMPGLDANSRAALDRDVAGEREIYDILKETMGKVYERERKRDEIAANVAASRAAARGSNGQ